jgi:hypothetical protein
MKLFYIPLYNVMLEKTSWTNQVKNEAKSREGKEYPIYNTKKEG